jgi:hypothetical protein
MSYIKLHRQIQESEIWKSPEPFSRRDAWIDLLLIASHNSYKTIIDNKPVHLQRGDFCASIRFLMRRWKWGTSKTLAYLAFLTEQKMLSKIRTGNGTAESTIYHIEKYDTYQSWESDDQNGSQNSIRTGPEQLQNETKNHKQSKEPILLAAGPQKAGTNGHRDEAYETFANEFRAKRLVPYQSKSGDFVRLASLRKALGTVSKASPEGWHKALGHYFGSPLSAYTIADLCSRFDIFIAGPVDRFGKPGADTAERKSSYETLDDHYRRLESK